MPDLDALDDALPPLLRHVGRTCLLEPWARARQSAREKAPGEWVTDADLAAEAALRTALEALAPDVPIVGEEGEGSDTARLGNLGVHDWLWLVDPLDGTGHFARGEPSFGVMLALLRQGRTEAAWIHLPVPDRMAAGRRGRGVTLDGERVRLPASVDGARRGVALTRFFPEAMKTRAEAHPDVRTTDVHKCAALRTFELLEGEEHYAAYWRTLPWDHAPGAFLLQEAGGVACRLDAAPFEPQAWDRPGLLLASDATTWCALREVLAPDQAGSPKVSS